jgi:CHAT domain-containing protein
MKWVLAPMLLIFVALSVHAGFAASAPEAVSPEELRKILDAPPPDPKENSKAALAKIYLERGRAAATLGDFDRELKEILAGLQVVGEKDPAAYDLHDRHAQLNLDRGNLVQARAAREAAVLVAGTAVRRFFQFNHLSSITAALRDRQSAKDYLTRAEGVFSAARRGNLEWNRFGDFWQAALSESRGNYNLAFGYIAEAEGHYRSCVTAIRTYLAKNPNPAEGSYYYLPQCLSRFVEQAARLGHLREAGAYVNDVPEAAKKYAQSRQRVLFETRMTRSVARVYLELGLIKEAEDLLQQTIAQLQKVDAGDAAVQVSTSRALLAMSQMAQGNWLKADEIFRARRDSLRGNAEQEREIGSATIEWGYTLLRLGRLDEALKVLEASLKFREQRYDEQSLYLWEGRAFHALGVGASGQVESAVAILSRAIPKITELSKSDGKSGEAGYLTAAAFNWVLDGYVALLAELHTAGKRMDGIVPIAEAYRMADLARGSRVQKALSAAIIRASVSDPQLAAVIRRAQDLDYQVKATSEALTALQSVKSEKPDPNREKAIEKIRTELERLREENEKAQAELKRKLPDYSELLDPKPLTIAETQKLLKPQEALIAIYSTQKQTLVWAVPAAGQPAFHIANLSSTKVAEGVTQLRKALDPSEIDIGQVPTFDFNAAHEIYQKLLAPVEAGWKSAKELIIVPHGALAELPFSVLVTAPYKPVKSAVPFADHAAAPWLIKNAAVSYLPSLAALASLRRGDTQRADKSFIGFGDPVFGSAAKPATALASRGLMRRNAKSASAPSNPSSGLELLEPLPDTAEEVRDIAKILRADESRDLFLGRRASEQTVKSTDLTQYRVVMFATHGLVAKELPDLTQPALALSNPAVTGEKEDGFLTLAEILGLKMRADWVVLSACNTASPDGQASEAVSGLGRAFFFAGAKALLVSHWPVETVSAKLLTTELFKRQSTDAKSSRAEALRQASLTVMQQIAKPAARGASFSYAHPMFWAPFVVVGDGG